MVLSAVLVVTQVEVVLEGVTKHDHETSQVQKWLTRSVVTVKELGLVATNKTSWLHSRSRALGESLVELNNRRKSLSGWVGADVLDR